VSVELDMNMICIIQGAFSTLPILCLKGGYKIIVNFLGQPSAGKTTLAMLVAGLLKLEGSSKCEYVPEYAKDLTWENRQDILKNQIYVFGKQLNRIERVYHKVNIVVTDSPLLTNLAYCDNECDDFKTLVLRKHHGFENINYFLTRIKDYDPIGRNQSADEARVLHDKIEKNSLD